MKAWAIVDKKGKIVRNEKRLKTLLVFKTKREAVCNVWEDGERVIRVSIISRLIERAKK
jgi:hypothetical protein